MSALERWRRSYGSSPLHLLSLLACFALAGYAALQARHGPLPIRMAIWFVGAAVAHDLVLFPLYALVDRVLRLPVRGARSHGGGFNYVRVPLLLSGLLLLMFYPLVLRRSEGPYGNASGLDQHVYLGHWLLVTAALLVASAVLYAARVVRVRRRVPVA